MVQPSPFPAAPPPPAALTSGVMMLLVKARIRVLNARAMTSPTAITINSPCIRKLRNPLSIVTPPAPVAPVTEQYLSAATRRGRPGQASPPARQRRESGIDVPMGG